MTTTFIRPSSKRWTSTVETHNQWETTMLTPFLVFRLPLKAALKPWRTSFDLHPGNLVSWKRTDYLTLECCCQFADHVPMFKVALRVFATLWNLRHRLIAPTPPPMPPLHSFEDPRSSWPSPRMGVGSSGHRSLFFLQHIDIINNGM